MNNHLSCLIVDDDLPCRLLAIEIFRKLNIEAQYASNGLEAIEICKLHLPDIIMLDWMMPKMNGLQFINAIKPIYLKKTPRIIMCSAKFDNNFIKESIIAGADEYIRKPLHLADVERLIKTHNDRFRKCL